MSAINYCNIEVALDRIHTNLGFDNMQESDLIEWIGTALDNMLAPGDMGNRVALIEVRDHQCMIPDDVKSIIQIAKNNCYDNPTQIVEDDLPEAEETLNKYVVKFPKILDCKGNVLGNYKLAYYTERERTHLDDFNIWTGSPINQRCFTPVRLSNHSFFNSLVCKENNWEDLYNECGDEYTIEAPYLVFSFREGSIALSYNKLKVDDNGLPLIPDHKVYMDALVAYVRYMMTYKMYDQGTRPLQALVKAEQDWQWYIGQARTHSLSLKSVDERENMKNQRGYLLPRQNSYFGFFGRNNKPENRIYHRSHYRR